MTFVRETRIVFARSMRLSLRNPVWVIIGLTQPILDVVLFGPLLEKIGGQLGGDPWQVFVPGMLVQLGMFGAMFVGRSGACSWACCSSACSARHSRRCPTRRVFRHESL